MTLKDPAYNTGKFGEVKELVLGMLDTYNYEKVYKNTIPIVSQCVEILQEIFCAFLFNSCFIVLKSCHLITYKFLFFRLY